MSKTTKEDILIVALHLFARDGYEAVSVSQIAGELGMTKGALYRHFESKSMEIVEADKKATMFYSIMFFYYSLYDGSKDKKRIKERFEKSISSII